MGSGVGGRVENRCLTSTKSAHIGPSQRQQEKNNQIKKQRGDLHDPKLCLATSRQGDGFRTWGLQGQILGSGHPAGNLPFSYIFVLFANRCIRGLVPPGPDSRIWLPRRKPRVLLYTDSSKKEMVERRGPRGHQVTKYVSVVSHPCVLQAAFSYPCSQ